MKIIEIIQIINSTCKKCTSTISYNNVMLFFPMLLLYVYYDHMAETIHYLQCA